MSDSNPIEGKLNNFVWANEGNLPGFQELLESWVRVYQKCCCSIWPEFLWEYTERPQIGLLSNAAVLIGGIALEEWGTEKAFGGNNSYGRNDLWLRLHPTLGETDYQVEAKHSRLSVRKPMSEAQAIIAGTIENAKNAAKELISKNGEINVAMSFITLQFSISDTTSLDNKTNELLQRIKENGCQETNCDAVAAIWLDAKTFELSRTTRLQLNPQWRNNDVGLILLANRMS